MMATELMSLAQFGFAAIMAYLLWTSYREIIPRLLTIIEQNSHALADVAGGMRQVSEGQRDAAVRLGRMDDRLLALELRHENPVRQCPIDAAEIAKPAEHFGMGVKADGR